MPTVAGLGHAEIEGLFQRLNGVLGCFVPLLPRLGHHHLGVRTQLQKRVPNTLQGFEFFFAPPRRAAFCLGLLPSGQAFVLRVDEPVFEMGLVGK